MGLLKPLSIGLVAVGLIVLVLGIVLGFVVVPNIIENKVEDEAQLKEGTDIYEKWLDLPVPINLKFYFFNVTNYDKFQSGDGGDWSTKPIVQQVGPYVYKEKRVKYDITHNDEADTVSYRQNITYDFVLEESAGPDTDLVSIINVPLVSIATVMATLSEEQLTHLPLPPKQIMQLLLGPLSRERYIKQDVTVKDVIFGWRLNSFYDLIVSQATAMGLTFPPELQHGQFGFYLDRNATNADGLWEVFTGSRDSSKFSTIKFIDGKNKLDEWWTDQCAMINGTDGTMFPPFIEKDTILYAYSPEICRSVWLEYTGDMEYEGISGYRFQIPKKLFTSPVDYPPNQCFCMPVPKPLNDSCDFTGGGRMFSCKSGAPIVMSKPHFMDAETILYEFIDGLETKPDPEKYDTFIDVEPYTGFPLRANKRLQIGLETQPIISLGAPWDTIPHMFFPAIWADEAAALTPELVDEIKSKLVKPLKMVEIGKWSVIGIGTFITLAGVVYFSYLTWFKTNGEKV